MANTIFDTDFQPDDEVEEFKELWNNSVDMLKRNLGI